MIAASVLLAIAEIFKAASAAQISIAATQTPAQQAEFWKRWLDSTEWMSKLLAKFSDQIEKLIEADTPKA